MAAPTLKAKKNKSFYKSEKAYIDAVYRNNKAYIDSHVPTGIKASPQAFFRAEVLRTREMYNQETKKNFTIRRAIKRVANSKMMNPGWKNTQIKANNFESLLKKDKFLYKDFRNKTKDENKRYTKFDYTKVNFEGYHVVNNTNASIYSYDKDLYVIEFVSPPNGTGSSYEIWTKAEYEQALGKTVFFKGYTSRKKNVYNG
jgi:hypothetical protein